MSVFQSTKYFPFSVPDLSPVANDVMENFRRQGYEVKGEQTVSQGWNISVHKGNIFKSVLGMKTALNIEIETTGTGTLAKAGVGIFGLQAIPTAIMLFVAWPILLTQIWGLVQQAKLDDEALLYIERCLTARSGKLSGSVPHVAEVSKGGFCTQCGADLQTTCNFCPNCGKKIE